MSRLRILRKLPLTTKQVNKGYYKGTGSGSMGWHTKHGGYRIDWKKVRTYIVPTALEGFKLTPFVTKKMKPLKGDFAMLKPGLSPMSGEYYLRRWEEGGSGV
ncbi:MAG: hypothetical protein GOMPHAMPRED_003542 [Gomphillus americanus]|uniref:Mitochondrial ribosomal protein L27 n=1 Tax=Gomphillus americanus TaxID=1940652 RepID=A0A8H3FIA3_9LECA|nr:MAG: hypothetical protein GOMPHAMPRED_003542 [Gomphillus americanus]